ncbi:TusE/DsrC/DsvC family sulfur relay protein [Rhodobium gokarnense]|uniref:tRNA 2-thiouridine synthesizing protein E n=1 Tax=Rhodobium gokarnense TaxID=364296 RepID=A0ABT3HBF2_9HYPH|nr:TusE/DsrC/DsvC family sulfur relay protein [Rhodobium gokarnense]MCW2307723.1 tRNA 2-thiouridine synthesizing protein E [Rhodobium gokarnense]
MRTRPDVVTEDVVGDRTVRRDEAGYLVDPEDWDAAVAEKFAEEEGVELGEEHWAVLAFMREFLAESGVAPDARFAFRFLAARHGESEAAARRRFFALFPYGYVKQACKIAGMKQPRAWSTG